LTLTIVQKENYWTFSTKPTSSSIGNGLLNFVKTVFMFAFLSFPTSANLASSAKRRHTLHLFRVDPRIELIARYRIDLQ